MKPKQDESYQSWAERVRMFEQGRALQRIAQGDDVNIVMEDMARRIVDKMLHPIYRELHVVDPIDIEESRRTYYETMARVGPAADHVDVDT
jgi:glutamyl-tRNA reductase